MFERKPGSAKDVGIGADGSVWVIGTNAVPGGYGVHRWDGNRWAPIDGGGLRIAVDPDGNPWVVNSSNQIFQRRNGAWSPPLPGSAKDIGIGTDGSAWVIGTNEVPGGYGIHRWNGNGWIPVDGGGVRIAVDDTGNPWVVNSSNQIFQRRNGAWSPPLPGSANDIGIGGNPGNLAWIIGTDEVPGGFGIHWWTGGGWAQTKGGGVNIAVSPSRDPWVVNDRNEIHAGAGIVPS